MRRRIFFGVFLPAMIALFSSSAGAVLPSGDLMARLREASAVAPLRMHERTVTAVLPGHFSGRRADAVVITNDNASLCRGPDYQRCLALGHLPTKRTVATTIKGESTLLVLDGLSSIRQCTIDANRDRASLNCRNVDISKLKDYNASTLADGKLLQIEGTDGKYLCSSSGSGGWPSCTQVTQMDGRPAIPTKAERMLQKKHGKTFQPLDQPEKACRVKRGEIACNDRQKFSDLGNPFGAMMRPAALYFEIDEDDERDWVYDVFDTVTVTGTYNPGAPMDMGWWLTHAAPPQPPNYWQQQCLAICAQQDTDYGDVCRISAGLALFLGPVIAGGYYLACEAGRGYHNWDCRHNICGLQ